MSSSRVNFLAEYNHHRQIHRPRAANGKEDKNGWYLGKGKEPVKILVLEILFLEPVSNSVPSPQGEEHIGHFRLRQ